MFAKKITAVSLSVFVVFAIAFAAGSSLRNSANVLAINGLEVSGQEVNLALGGYDYEEVRAMLEEEMETFLNRQFSFTYEDETGSHSASTSYKQLGVTVNIDDATELIKDLSEGDGVLEHLKNRIAAIGGSNVQIPFRINPVIFKYSMGQLLDLKQEQSAQVMVNENRQPYIQPDRVGRGIDEEMVLDELNDHLKDLAFPESLLVTISSTEPEYNAYMAMGDMSLWAEFLKQEVHLKYQGGVTIYENTLPVPAGWAVIENGKMAYNASNIQAYLRDVVAPEVNQEKQDAYLRSFPEGGEGYVEIEGIPQDGQELDVYLTASNIISVLERNMSQESPSNQVVLSVEKTSAEMVNETSEDLGPLEFLGMAQADFSNSSDARGHNVRKAVNERLGNYLIAPGATLSYNQRLSFHSTSGWVVGYGIFGGEAKPVLGGGVCHGSTLLGRGLQNIQANVNLIEHYNHSWYLASYYGDEPGRDFTIYPGGKDLRATNDTGNYLLMQAHTEGDMAYIRFYGQGDGRSVAMHGPYYNNNDLPEEYKHLMSLYSRQIGWVKEIEYEDGTIELIPFVSAYASWYG